MTFYSVRDLRTDTKGMWESLSSGNEVVITNNGKPAALMIDIPADSFDEVVQAVRQAKAMIAFNNMRRKAAAKGFMSDEEIEAEIQAAWEATDADFRQTLELAAENISRSLYGNYSGALTIYNLPLSLMAAITAAVIAAVSAALARRDRRGAARITGSALRITALLAFPMGVGLFVLGTPIIRLIFPELDASVAGPLLSTLGIASIFVCLMLVCNSVLQAHGFINLPVVIMALGGVVKIVTNYNLVAVPTIGISGAPVGNVLSLGLCMVLDLVVIARVIHGRPDYLPLLAKPAAAAGVMGLGAWAVYGLLSKLLSYEEVTQAGETIQTLGKTGNGIAVMGAILIAVIIYAVLVVALRAISREDLSLMPKGDKIAKILRL